MLAQNPLACEAQAFQSAIAQPVPEQQLGGRHVAASTTEPADISQNMIC